MLDVSKLNFEGAIDYHYGQFPPAELDYQRLMLPIIEATEALARFDQMLLTLKNTDILLAPLRNQEAVISSRMEGTVSTMDEILELEAKLTLDEDITQESKNVRSEVVETYLYQRTLRYAEKAMRDGQIITEHFIRSLHQLLLSIGRGARKSPGSYKDEQNYIIDSFRNVRFVPIAPERLNDGVRTLINYLGEEETPVLLKTAIAHLEFEALHPFKDGNGRVGRMLITLMLWHEKLISAPHFYVSGYLEDHKESYLELMRNVSSENAWTNWCVFFLRAVKTQAERNLDIALSISKLYEEMKIRFSDVLNSKYSLQTIDYIFENPIFRNTGYVKNSGIPPAAARRLTPLLEQAGLLSVIEKGSGQRATLYRFEPMMKLVRV